MIEKTEKDFPTNGGTSPIQPLVRVKNVQSGVLFKAKGEKYENTHYKWRTAQRKYVAVDGDRKKDFI